MDFWSGLAISYAPIVIGVIYALATAEGGWTMHRDLLTRMCTWAIVPCLLLLGMSQISSASEQSRDTTKEEVMTQTNTTTISTDLEPRQVVRSSPINVQDITDKDVVTTALILAGLCVIMTVLLRRSRSPADPQL
jgi:cytochrome bd-type quinol oxidase subunit 2